MSADGMASRAVAGRPSEERRPTCRQPLIPSDFVLSSLARRKCQRSAPPGIQRLRMACVPRGRSSLFQLHEPHEPRGAARGPRGRGSADVGTMRLFRYHSSRACPPILPPPPTAPAIAPAPLPVRSAADTLYRQERQEGRGGRTAGLVVAVSGESAFLGVLGALAVWPLMRRDRQAGRAARTSLTSGPHRRPTCISGNGPCPSRPHTTVDLLQTSWV